MPYIAYLPYIPNIPYFPDMPYQTDHTHHTYPTYHTTPPPHHRGRRGTVPHPHHTTGGERDSTTPPPHHRGGGGRSHMGAVYGTHPMGGEGGVAGPGAYIYIILMYMHSFAFFRYFLYRDLSPESNRVCWRMSTATEAARA